MSTVEVKMFTLVCDGCGADVNEGTDFAAYVQEFASREIADDQGWLATLENGRDWCPDCCEWDPDGNQRRPSALPAQRLAGLRDAFLREGFLRQKRAAGTMGKLAAEADPDVADTAWAIIDHHRQHRTGG